MSTLQGQSGLLPLTIVVATGTWSWHPKSRWTFLQLGALIVLGDAIWELQCLTMSIPAHIPQTCCVTFLDDLSLNAMDLNATILHLQEVFADINLAELYLNLKKCSLL